jgi:hypothetical protein
MPSFSEGDTVELHLSLRRQSDTRQSLSIPALVRRVAVDRFAGQARLHDIAVELHRVTVKGREFWRVRVTGFATAKEARSDGELTQKKLGLKDVWIFKRPTSDGQTG